MFGRQGEEKVAPEYLRHIARLSKLEVPAEKTEQLCGDLGKILAAVRQIQEVNTEGTAQRSLLILTAHLRRHAARFAARGDAAAITPGRGCARHHRGAGASQREGPRGGLFCGA